MGKHVHATCVEKLILVPLLKNRLTKNECLKMVISPNMCLFCQHMQYGAEQFFYMPARTSGRIARNNVTLDYDTMPHHQLFLNVSVKVRPLLV